MSRRVNIRLSQKSRIKVILSLCIIYLLCITLRNKYVKTLQFVARKRERSKSFHRGLLRQPKKLIKGYYFKAKVIGTIYHTGTFFPSRIPGVNFGSIFTTRIDSLSRDAKTPFRTDTSDTDPSSFTMKRIITFP